MLRDRRALFLLVPALLGLVVYNVSFFRDRARRMEGGSEPAVTAPPPSASASAPAAAPGAASAAAPATTPARPAPRSYEEALAWMTPPATHAELASLHSWAPRDIFHHGGGITALSVMTGPSPPAAVAAGTGAPAAAGSPAAAAAAEAVRVDGLVKTPHGTYAIVNGHLTKVGTALSPHERVVRIGRSGVVLSTMGGDKVLPLAGEVTPPRGNWESKP